MEYDEFNYYTYRGNSNAVAFFKDRSSDRKLDNLMF